MKLIAHFKRIQKNVLLKLKSTVWCERVNAVMKFQLLYLIGKFHDNFAASSSRKTFGLHSTGHMSDIILKSSLQRESGQE